MDSALKQRLIGAAVLVALAMIFLPMLLQGPDEGEPDAAQVPLSMPDAPDAEFETRELPLALPEPAGEGSVLGAPAPVLDDPNAVATVDVEGTAAPRVDAPLPEPAGEAPAQAVDAATGEPLAAATETPPAPAAAPAPETAPEPAPAALPASTGGGRFAVNVGTFSNTANAEALAGRLQAAGLPVLRESLQVDGKAATRLRVGPYAERTVAEAARLRAEAASGSRAVVVTLDAAAPAPARAATAPAVGFAVQLGAFSSEADANALRDRARGAGFVAFVQRINTDRGAVWRVRVGPEADRDAAERLRTQLGERLGLRDTLVVPHP